VWEGCNNKQGHPKQIFTSTNMFNGWIDLKLPETTYESLTRHESNELVPEA
jgi:hypothetical protein